MTRLLFIVISLLLMGCQPQFKTVEVSPEDIRKEREAEAQQVQEHAEEAMARHRPPTGAGLSMPGGPLTSTPDANAQQVDWRLLRGLNVKTGEVTPSLKKLEGGIVRMVGYMVPFEDEFESVSEFLLVPQAGMCVHLPPPPMNQIVLVQMTGGTAPVNWAKPVTVSGVLEIAKSESPYGAVSFRLAASAAREDQSAAY